MGSLWNWWTIWTGATLLWGLSQEASVYRENPRGEEFLAVFMQNFYAGSTDANLHLLVTSMSNRVASVSVLSHADDTSQKVTVRPGQTVKVNIGDKAEMVGSTTFRHAVVVHSDQRVSVQAVNFKPETAELTHLWPVSALGTEYFVFTPPSAWVAPEFAVVAGATGARVSMKLKGAVTFKGKSYPAGQVLSVSLQPYEVAQVQSDSDLSGSKVTSSSPVAVFSGHTCAQKHTTCNHVVEQLLPTSAWGTHYVVATLDSQNLFDLAYVVASQPTKVTYNHGGTTGSRQLKEGQVAEFEVQPSRPLHLTADRGIQVLLLSTGALTDELAYDPYLVLVPDVASYCSSYVVKAVPDSTGVALVVAPTKAAEQLTLDTHSLRNQLTWTAVPGSEFSFAEVALGSEDTNHIAKAPVNFGLLTIGLDQAVGYGTSAACVQRTTQEVSTKPGSTGGAHVLPPSQQNLNSGSGQASLHLLDSSPSATPGSGLSQPEDSSQEITATPDPSTTLNKPGLSEGAPSGPSASVPGGKTKPQAAGLTHLRPVGALGTEYFVLTPPSSGNLKEFAVRAGPTGARVDIQLKLPVTFQGTSYRAGQVLSVTLKPNQVALMQSDSDLSGSRVTASSPVAVFSGHNCAQEDSTACGQVVRQLLPTSAWGTDYVVASQNSQKPYDVAYVVAKQTTKLTYNHGGTTGFRWLKKGEVAEFDIRPSRPLHLTADKGIQVLQFGTGTSRDGATSDPELVLVPDVASYCSSYVVKTEPDSAGVALVVAPTKAAEQLTLDTHSLRNLLSWTAVPGSEFSFAEVALGSEDKNHIIKAPANFGLLPFGIQQAVDHVAAASCGRRTTQEVSTKPGSTGGAHVLPPSQQNLNSGSGQASLHLLDSSPSATPGSGLSQPEDSSQEITATPDPSTMLNNNDKPGLSEGAPSGPSASVPGGKTKPQAAGLTHLRPVGALGTEYFVLTPPSSGNLKEFAVRAGPTGARVDIQLKLPVTFQGTSYRAGQVLSVTLKPNQVALMQSDSDLSGSRVTASSPVAVFSGHNCAQEDSTACGRVVRQLLPTSAWGTDYVVASQNSQKPYDVAYVVAKQTTKLTYNHGGTTGFRWLKKGEVAEFDIQPSRPLHLTADKGIQVLQFGTGTSRDGATSDPELVLVPDVASYCSSYVVKSMPGSERVALVVAPTKAAEQLTLDTHSLRNQLTWTAVPGSEFSFAEVALGSEDKNHIIKAPANFGLLPFGIQQAVDHVAAASCGRRMTQEPTVNPEDPRGEEFLAVFMQNFYAGSTDANLYLLVTSMSNREASVSVLSHADDTSQKVTVRPRQTVKVNIGDKAEMVGSTTFRHAVVVHSDQRVSVQAVNFKPKTAELTHLWPVSALGTEYFVFTPPSAWVAPEFAVVAGATGARVSMKLKGAVTFKGKSYPAGQVLSVSLQPYEVAQVQSDSDLSGSKVTSSSPVAVFSGHTCAQKHTTCNHVVEQLLPTSAWGTHYVVATLDSQNVYDLAYVVASQPTKVTYNHGGTTGSRQLKEGQVAEFEVQPSRPLHLTADRGIQVLLLSTGALTDELAYDPYLVLVPDVASYCSSYVVKAVPDSAGVALVVAPTKAAEQLTLDTHSLRNQLTWTAVPGSEFSIAEVALGSEDTNHIAKAPVNFGLLTIGLDQAVGYGTSAACVQRSTQKDSMKPGSTGGEKMLTQFLQNLNPGSGNASLHLLDSSPSATPGSGLSQPEDSSQEITATPDPSTMLNNNDKPGLSEGAPSGPSASVPGGKTKPQAAGLTHLRPVSALGTEYFVLTPPSSGNLKEFAVRAGPTGARVDIQLKRPVTFQGTSYPAGQVLSVTLKPNQVALMQSDSDLSGSRVTASSPVAVFSGHNCAQEDSTACGRVVRQLLPTSAWGTDYVVASQNSQKPYDVAYVVAKQTTKLTYNHGGTTGFRWLKKGEVAEFEIRPSRPLHLTADKGTQVLQFGTGTSRDGATSDPELVLVPDVASYCSSYVVKSMPGSERVALVVAPTKAAEQLTLDTHSLRNQLTWTAVPGSEFSFAEVALGSEDKNHNLKAPFNFGLLPFGIRQPVHYGTGASCGQKKPGSTGGEKMLTQFLQNLNPGSGNASLHLLDSSPSATPGSGLSQPEDSSQEITTTPDPSTMLNNNDKPGLSEGAPSGPSTSVPGGKTKPQAAGLTHLRPVSALGTEYFVLTPPSSGNLKEFAVRAGPTGTRVDIQLKRPVTFQGTSYPAGQVLSVTLKPNQVALMQSDSDLSGSRVTASSPVAVFSGHNCAQEDSTACGRVVRQLLPTSAWGTDYLVASQNSQKPYDVAYVVAKQTTKLTYNHGGTTGFRWLKKGEVAEFEIRPSRPLHLTADKGIQVLQFGTGTSRDGATSDPELVLVPDVASYCSSYVVKSMPGSERVALVVAPTKAAEQLTLDTHSLRNQLTWTAVPGSEFSFAEVALGSEDKNHIIKAPANFGLLPFGIQQAVDHVAAASCGRRMTQEPTVNPEDPRGEEFLAVFMQNFYAGSTDANLYLLVTSMSNREASVSVLSHADDTSQKVTVRPRQTVKVNIGDKAEMVGSTTFRHAVVVHSDQRVSVQAVNFKPKTAELTHLWPVSALGTEYFVFTPPSAWVAPEFAVVAGATGARVSMKLKGAVTFKGKSYPAGQVLSVSLQPYEVAQVQSDSDLSGSKVTSSSPVAVFSGHTCAQKHTTCNHVVEQLLPTSAWGTHYVVATLDSQNVYDLAYVVASQPTKVTYNHGGTTGSRQLKEGQVAEFEVQPSRPLHLTADRGIQVLLLSTGALTDELAYDPYLVLVPDVASYCSSYVVKAVPDSAGVALVVAPTKAAEQLTLDTHSLRNQLTWTAVPGSEFSIAEVALGSEDTNHIAKAPVNFGLLTIGLDQAVGYGTSAACVQRSTQKDSMKPGSTGGEKMLTQFLQNLNPGSGNASLHLLDSSPSATPGSGLSQPEDSSQEITATPDPSTMLNNNDKPGLSEGAPSGPSTSVPGGKTKPQAAGLTHLRPVGALGTEYFVLTPPSSGNLKEFAVRAGPTGARVDIQLKRPVTFQGTSYPAGQVLSVTLKPNQVALIQSDSDLSGSRVTASSPVAVFSGHNCAQEDSTACGRVVRQLLPTSAWGTDYVVASQNSQKPYDVAYVVAKQTTKLTYNHGGTTGFRWLKKGEVAEFEIRPSRPLHLTADKGTQVLQFGTGTSRDGATSDPELVLVPDVASYCSSYVVKSMPGSERVALVVAPTKAAEQLTLDTHSLRNQLTWTAVPGSEFSFAEVALGSEDKNHNLKAPFNFGLLPFGIRQPVRYGTGASCGQKKPGSTGGEKMLTQFLQNLNPGSGNASLHLLDSSPSATPGSGLSQPEDSSQEITATPDPSTMLNNNDKPGLSEGAPSGPSTSVPGGKTKPQAAGLTHLRPVSALGTEYFVLTPPSSGNLKEFAVRAGPTGARVDIQLKRPVTFQGSSYPAGQVLSVTLKPNQVALMQSDSNLSGSRVTASSPVAVFSGHNCAQEDSTACGRVVRQLLPTSAWGTDYVVASQNSQKPYDVAYVVAKQTTKLTYNHGGTTGFRWLKKGEVAEFEIRPSRPLHLTADKGIQVLQFGTGTSRDGATSDPELVQVPDVASYCSSYVVKSMPGSERVALVVAPTKAAEQLTLDTHSLRNQLTWTAVPGSEFSFAEVALGSEDKNHIIKAPANFGLLPFGIRQPVRYGTGASCGQKKPGSTGGEKMLTHFLQNLNPGSGNASLHLLDSSPSATPGSGLSQPEDSSQEITATPDPSTMLNNNDKPGLSEGAPSGPSTSVPGGKTKPQAAGLTHLRPVSALGTEYFVLTPPSSGNLKEFAVRAGPTGARVDIQLKRPVTFQGTSYPAGQVLSVTLKPNQVALIQSDSDLSGSRVTASSPVAVFSGHNCAQEDSTACGRVVRQLLPTSAWGTDYVVASQNSQKPYDVAYVVAKQTTKLTYNHGGTTGFRWLKKGEVAEFEIRPSRPLHLTADKGTQVLQFGTGTSRDGATSDPELVLVPDVASYCSSYVVKSMPGSERVALVVAPTKAAEQLTLDTHSLRNQLTWTAVPGSEFSFAEVALGSEDKNHNLKAPFNFGLLPFGIRQPVRYGTGASCGQRMPQEVTSDPDDNLREEFLTVFMQNFNPETSNTSLHLLVTSMSDKAASVSVLSHADNTSLKVTVRPGHTVKVNIGSKAEMVGSTTFRHAVVVHSDQRVSVQAVNAKKATADVTQLRPVSALGTEYFVFTPPRAWASPEFAVVAGATGARVDMQLKGAVTFQGKSYPAGDVLSVTLQPYEVAQVQSDSDLSGSKVTASSPVAVFSGYTCAKKHTNCDHVVEQLLPTSAWGTHYVVATLNSQNLYDLAYVVASQPTKLTYNHGGTTGSQQLKEGEVAEFEVRPSRPLHLTADKGIQVLLFGTGASKDGVTYDPYLVLVPDVASYCSSYVVKTVPGSKGVALMVAPTKTTKQFTLDDHTLGDQLTWTAVPGSEFSFAETDLGSEDTNHVAKAPANFGLLTFGMDQYIGYGTSTACDQRKTQEVSMTPRNTVTEEFLAAFMQNTNAGSNNTSLHLLVTSMSDKAATVSVLSHADHTSQKVTVRPRQTVKVNISSKAEMVGSTTFRHAVVVHSDQRVSVQAVNAKKATADVTQLWPVSALGTEYFVFTPPNDWVSPEFAVVAGATGARVDMQLKGAVTFQGQFYPAGQVLGVTLKPYEVVQVQSYFDLSGSKVTASSPVAVFSGHTCATKHTTCDHVVEQLLPTSAWGTHYVVATLNSQNLYDLAYVVASQPTKLTYNHGGTTGSQQLKEGEVAEFEVRPSRPLHLTADKGIQVLLFGTGASKDGVTYDPYLVLVPDVASYCSSYVVKTVPGSKGVALMVAPTKTTKQFTLDDHTLGDQLTWTTVPGSEFSFAETDLGSEDTNHVAKAPANFGLLTFGMDQYIGYGTSTACDQRKTQEVSMTPRNTVTEEFLAAFMQNTNAGSNNTSLHLLVTSMSDKAATVSVLSHADHTSQKVTVRPRQTVKVNIGDKAEMVGSTTFQHAVVVHSDQRVSVQAVNAKKATADVTQLWPVSALGTEYFVFTPPSAWVSPEFAVVAGATGARVSMKLKGAVTFQGKFYPAGQVLSVTLQPYEVAQVQSDSDLSGSKITASSPVAVFSGHSCAQKHTTSCDHVVEQLLPTSAWGTHYVVATLDSQNLFDLAYVVASQPTKLTYNQGGITGSHQLEEGEVAEFEVQPSRPLHLTADKGIQVLLFGTGASKDGVTYDPYLVLVPDVASYCSSYVVKTVPGSKGVALMVAPTKTTKQFTLDDYTLGDQLTWTAVPGSEFSFAETDLSSEDTNHVAKAPANFGLLTFGMDQYIGYGTSTACDQRMSQEATTKTKNTMTEEFLTAFMQNFNPGSSNANLHLLVTSMSDQAATVSVLSHADNTSQKVTVRPGQTVKVNIGDKAEMVGSTTFRHAVVVHSDQRVSVQSVNFKPLTADLTHLWPVSALGTEYFVFTPPSAWVSPEFAVVAGATGARVSMKLKGAVTFQGKSYPAGQVLSVTLQPYEVAQVQSDSDLSGSKVTASSPVAVFSGHSCAQKHTTSCDHVVEQLLPTSAWGTHYVVATLDSQNLFDLAYVVAKQTTMLTYNHGGTTGSHQLKEGQVAEFEIQPSRPLYLTADKGIQVLQFGTGASKDRITYDPYLVLVPDVASYCSSYVVKTVPDSKGVALVVASTKDAEQLILDNHSLRNQLTWTAVPGSEFSFAEVALGSEDTNHVAKAPANFGLLPFGLDHFIGYGTSAACNQRKKQEVPMRLRNSRGKEFLAAFMQNFDPGSSNANLHLLVTSMSDQAATVSVLSHADNTSQKVTVRPGQTVKVNIGDKAEMVGSTTFRHAVVVHSDQRVSVQAVNFKPLTADLTHLWPVSALGTEYFVFTPPSAWVSPEFAVVAGATGARVSMKLKGAVTFKGKSYPAGQVLSVSLKPYEVAQVQSDSDLSGSKVTASSPVAVFSGHTCAIKHTTSCDHMVEQLLPTSAWGTHYVVTTLDTQNAYDLAYVVASQPTKVTYNHGGTTGSQQLKEGEVAEFEVRPSRPLHLTADKGIQVLLFGTGASKDGVAYDPYLVLVPDVASYCSSYVVKTVPGSKGVALVVASTKAAEQLILDNHSLRNQLTWTAVPGSEFSFAEVALGSEDTNHVIKGPANFGLLPFGLDQFIGYGTSAACDESE